MEMPLKGYRKKIAALLDNSNPRIRIRSNVPEDVRDLSRAKKRSLVAPLIIVTRGSLRQIENIVRPKPPFRFEEHRALFGVIVRRRVSLVVMIMDDAVHLLSIVDHDRILQNAESSGTWLVSAQFSSSSKMFVWHLKGVLAFLAFFARRAPGQFTRWGWSVSKGRQLNEAEFDNFLKENGAQFA